MIHKKSFFERLTGTVNLNEDDSVEDIEIETLSMGDNENEEWEEEETLEEGQLTVDVYETENDIIVKTMVAGVETDDLHVAIGRDTITIRGSRERGNTPIQDYLHNELYWGSFSRTLDLPEEVIPEESEATEKHGLLTLRLPKIDKGRQLSLKIKSE